MTVKHRMTEARELASRLDSELLATDKRLSGCVFLAHQDGSVLFYDRAFAQIWEDDFVIILTEHHGSHVYFLEDLRQLRALGSRLEIEEYKESKLPTVLYNSAAPKLDMDKIAKALGAKRGGKVSAKGGYLGALQTAAEVKELQKKKRP